MKYEQEFKVSKNKSEFVALVMLKYNVNPSTAGRRYYDLRKKLSHPPSMSERKTDAPLPIKFVRNENSDVLEPERIKLLLLDDAIRMKIKITRDFLLKHGFKPNEINWLLINEKIEWFNNEGTLKV